MSLPALTATEVYDQAFRAGLRPDPLLTVSEWADRYRRLSGKSASEPGPYRTERTPYLKQIMDALSPLSLVERVVVMKGAQLGFTEAGNNWIGYMIHKAPGPMLAVQPTVEMAKRNSKQRIDPLIQESEALRELVRSPRSRDSGNTVLSKEFHGGVLVMTGANSAVGLRSMSARYLFLDEIDAYPGDVEGEGDPINLAYARTNTFARRKVFLVSTPLISGSSRIEAVYAESDQRRYWLGITYEQLTGDLERVNYSSIRAGLLEFRRRCEQFQHQVMVFQFCRPVWRGWIEAAVLAGAISARDYRRNREAYLDVEWRPPSWAWVDPLKDMNAEVVAVRAGFKPRSAVINEMGYDEEDTDRQAAADNARADALGLTFDSDPRKTNSSGQPKAESEETPPPAEPGEEKEPKS